MSARRHRGATRHGERHRSERTGWLRAAVLGSDDAIVSTASIMLGMAAAGAARETILLSGLAGLAAGSMSMAAGEYVSVSSQRDAEQADVDVERKELKENPGGELHELATIYVQRGVERELAVKVAEQLSAHDRLGAHLRDELGIQEATRAHPLQAAWASALSFALSGMVPVIALLVAPAAWRVPAIVGVSLGSLAVLGAVGGRLGGAPQGRAALRVLLGGGLAMAVTAGVGRLLGVSTG